MSIQRKDVKVSILVAIYNIEKYIDKCIQSIISQEYKNLEIILLDDCSTDLSGKICDNYAERDKRIVTIHNSRNMRQSSVRNTGLAHATGDYIVFVDGDDWLASDYVTYMLKLVTETDADMAINLVNFTTRDKKQVKNQKIQVWSAEKATAELLFPHVTIGAWNKIYKREFIENNGLRFRMDLFTAEGYRFISDAAQRAEKIAVGCRKVYYYRQNNTGSATTKYDIRQSEGALYALDGIEKDLIIRTPYVMSALCQHRWLNHFWNLRQILALNIREEKRESFLRSLQYIRHYAYSVAKGEPSVIKKIKYCLTGVFPLFAASMKNKMFEIGLKRDVTRYHLLDEE